MKGKEIVDQLREKPFRPFRLTLENGQQLEVHEPRFAFVTATGMFLLYKASDDPVADVVSPPNTYELSDIRALEPLHVESN